MRKTILMGVAIWASVAACGPSATESLQRTVVASVLQAAYGPNDTIKVSVRNASGALVFISVSPPNCPVLERNTADGWEPADSDPLRLCPPDVSRPQWSANANDEVLIVQQPVLTWMASGDYRYRVEVGRESGGAVAITSNQFSIVQ